MENTKNMKHWSRNHFDPQKDTTDNWIRLHGLVAETDIVGGDNSTYHERLSKFKVDSDRSRDNVRTMFTELMTAKFSRAARICGMEYPEEKLQGLLLPAREASHISKSVVHDASEKNLERVCWTLYYSTTNIYKTIFGMEMSDYYEPVIMKKLDVCYEGAASTSKKGCVALWSNKLLNRYRTSVQESISSNKKCSTARINTNAPANLDTWMQTHGKPPTDKTCLYWIGTKNGTEKVQGKNGKEEERVKIEWRWVRIYMQNVFLIRSSRGGYSVK